jgi:hypothetical protein
MTDRAIAEFVKEAKEALVEIAEGAMQFPRSEPFLHGVEVGKYQGLRFALGILENILSDVKEKEKHS